MQWRISEHNKVEIKTFVDSHHTSKERKKKQTNKKTIRVTFQIKLVIAIPFVSADRYKRAAVPLFQLAF